LINQQSKRRDPNTLFSKVMMHKVQQIDTNFHPPLNNAENPEEVSSPEPRKDQNKQGEIISPERNPFRRNRFAIKPQQPENDRNSDSYKDPYRGLETPNPHNGNLETPLSLSGSGRKFKY